MRHSDKFWKSSEIFRKWSEIFGKSSITPSLACLYNNMVARRYEFYVLVAGTISHSFAALTREILFLPLEHKIHIFSPPCNILYRCELSHSNFFSFHRYGYQFPSSWWLLRRIWCLHRSTRLRYNRFTVCCSFPLGSHFIWLLFDTRWLRRDFFVSSVSQQLLCIEITLPLKGLDSFFPKVSQVVGTRAREEKHFTRG